ncbi:hypothetical protein GQ464_006750 [Rhodocaloribacter litoris]|uniref:hypothetical protein n=1 Tax=Rhodocaloribacter litoris TaxID=2558931 RepID=UPI00141FB801|nr:hypothetical protein [Rhodocaloribacter litoris]QXD16634.1 hypothetical protein GQ464_006750 [Rhodocaloribacter litoris]
MTRATLAVAVLLLGWAGVAQAAPPDDDPQHLYDAAREAVEKARWDVFSKRLVEALHTKHDGLREAAMRLIIQYGDRVDVKDAVFDVMRLYRDHDDENLRRMAIVTLGSMKSNWAISFLRLSEEYEKSPALKQTIRAVVARHHNGG